MDEQLSRGTQILNVVAANTVTRRIYYSTLARLVNAPDPVFTASVPDDGPSQPRTTRRGGNRRVVSRHRSALPIPYDFDDLQIGLVDAVARSTSLMR